MNKIQIIFTQLFLDHFDNRYAIKINCLQPLCPVLCKDIDKKGAKLKKHLWLAGYLIKDSQGVVTGYKTVVEASDMANACIQTLQHIHKHFEVDNRHRFLTNVGMADEYQRRHLDKVIIDMLADNEWPE